jgi:elongation factor 1 alpha-like protein
VNYFETPNREITLLDAPGNIKYVKNLMRALSIADAAILVIDANEGEFESGL